MANRYWVGGTGSWNAVNTANWSASSGGAGGASVPTASDDVFFDANSGAGSVTIGTNNTPCGSLDCTGFTGGFGSAANALRVFGNFKLSSGMTGFSAGVYLAQTTGTWNVDTAGFTLAYTFIFGPFGGAAGGATYVLQSNLTVTYSSGIQNYGTVINTNGFTVTTSSLSNVTGSNHNWIFGSSTVNLSGATPLSINSTANYGTSTINCSSASALTFNGGATFYNVNFTGGGTTTIATSGANTFNNLSITATTAGTKTITFAATNTISGSLTTSGTTSANRIQFSSSVSGTQRTLSVATIGTLTNTNWQDIALTGAASPWTAPVGVWNLGNNSGITFDTTTLYRIGGAGTWTDGTKWSTSSGGAAANVAPGPNNSVIFDASSGTGTVTCGSGYCNDFTASSSSALTFSGINLVYGSSTIGGSGTFTAWTPTYSATSTGKTIASGGKTVGATTFNGVGGGWTLSSAFNCGTNAITLTAGSLNTNGQAVTAGSISSSNTNVRSLTLGASTITLSGTAPIVFATTTNFTFSAGTSSIIFTSTAAITFQGGGLTYYEVRYQAGTATTSGNTWAGANTYTNLILGSSVTAGATLFWFDANQTVNGTFTVSSAAVNKRVVLMPSDYLTPKTITAAAVSLTNVDFVKIIGAGTATWSGTSVGDGGNNTNITFTTPKTVYWSLAAGGGYATSTAWATTSGGVPAVANYPLGQDTVIINDTNLNSGASISAATIGVIVGNITFASRTLPVSIGTTSNPFMAGDVTLSSVVTFSNAQVIYFMALGKTLTFNGGSIFSGCAFYGGTTTADAGTISSTVATSVALGSSLSLGGNLTCSAAGFTVNGTATLNNYTVQSTTCTLGASSTTNFGTGKIKVTSNNTTVFTGNATQTVTGTPVVECSYSGATGTRTIVPAPSSGSIPEANAISFNITAGTDIVTFPGTAGVYVKNLDFTGFSGSASIAGALNGIYGNLTLSSGMTSFTSSVTPTFRGTSGTKTITTAGKTLDFPITFDGAGSTWQLVDNLTQGSTRATKLTNGTLDLNGKTFSAGTFIIEAGTKNITFNGGILNVTGSGSAFSNANPTGFTTTAGTGSGTIRMSGSTAKTFAGGGSTYNCTLENYNTSALTISGSNTFTTLLNSFVPTTWTFTSGTTTTLTNWLVNGTSGNLVTINATSTSQATLSKASGTVSVSYCTISYSNATGGALWQAYTSNGNVNGGNNSGWDFGSSGNGLFFGSNF